MPSIIADGHADLYIRDWLLTSSKRRPQEEKSLLGCRVFPKCGDAEFPILLNNKNLA
jgi:hypothetical protein